MGDAGRVRGGVGPLMGLRPRPQGRRFRVGWLAEHLSGALPTPQPPARGVGYTDVGTQAGPSASSQPVGEKTDLQKVMILSEAAASTNVVSILPHVAKPSSSSCNPGRGHSSRKPSQIPHGVRGSCLSLLPPLPACVPGRQGWPHTHFWAPRPGAWGLQRAAGKGVREGKMNTVHSQVAGEHRWTSICGPTCGLPPPPDSPLGIHLCSWSWTLGAEAGIALLW